MGASTYSLTPDGLTHFYNADGSHFISAPSFVPAVRDQMTQIDLSGSGAQNPALNAGSMPPDDYVPQVREPDEIVKAKPMRDPVQPAAPTSIQVGESTETAFPGRPALSSDFGPPIQTSAPTLARAPRAPSMDAQPIAPDARVAVGQPPAAQTPAPAAPAPPPQPALRAAGGSPRHAGPSPWDIERQNVRARYATREGDAAALSSIDAETAGDVSRIQNDALWQRRAADENARRAQEPIQQAIDRSRVEVEQRTADYMQQPGIDPDHYFSDEGTGSRIMAGIATALLAFGGGPAGLAQGIGHVNAAIDRDIKAQQANLEKQRGQLGEARTLYETNIKRLGDAQSAAAMTRAQALQDAQDQIQARVAESKQPQIQAQAKAAFDALEEQKQDALKLVNQQQAAAAANAAAAKAARAEKLENQMRARQKAEDEHNASVASTRKTQAEADAAGDGTAAATKQTEMTEHAQIPAVRSAAANVLATMDATGAAGTGPAIPVVGGLVRSMPTFRGDTIKNQQAIDSLAGIVAHQRGMKGEAGIAEVKHEIMGNGSEAAIRNGVANVMQRLDAEQAAIDATSPQAAATLRARQAPPAKPNKAPLQ